MRPRALIAIARPVAAQLTELWQQAADVRREWLDVGLTTEPADRSTAEEAITSIYARHRRARPTFVWVDSPRAALPYLGGLPTHETLRSWVGDRRPSGRAPLASDIAAGLALLRRDLDDGVVDPPRERSPYQRKKNEPWPDLPAPEALRLGIPFLEILRQDVRESVFRSLAHGVYLPVRAALRTDGPPPISWYGNQDAAWVAYYDALRRLGLLNGPAWFDTWTTLTRAAGWWWPGEDRCVLVERPRVLKVSPLRGAKHDEVQVDAVEYRDGWAPPLR